jgi:signal transduction histidine kinase
MAERHPQLHRSVFAKLVAIMATLGVCLIVMVSMFFWLVVTRDFHSLIRKDIAHDGLLVLMLLMIIGIVIVAHAFLRHLLRPLHDLRGAVARLADGALDVHVPRTTGDEFGLLTDGFNHMVSRVGAMVRTRDQLLADVSHELRSPLTRMKVTVELLPPDERRARLAEDVVEMERMVSELLELERLRSGSGLRLASEDLAALARDVAKRYAGTAPGVVVRAPTSAVECTIDGEKVRAVLRNLVENAVKYSLPDSRPVEMTVVEGGDSVVIRVADDGVGVPAEETDRLFEPFYRVDRSRSKSTGGYGLGLSICKRVMDAHGGSIVLERSTGRGAAFVLTFPKRS